MFSTPVLGIDRVDEVHAVCVFANATLGGITQTAKTTQQAPKHRITPNAPTIGRLESVREFVFLDDGDGIITPHAIDRPPTVVYKPTSKISNEIPSFWA
jgi:hypothetical protein